MKRWKKVVLCALATVVVALGILVVPTVWGKPWSVNHFYARTFLGFMLERPQMMSRMGLLEPYGLAFYNDDLDDYSVEATRRQSQAVRDDLEMLRRYDRAELDDPLSHEVLEQFLLTLDTGREFDFHDYPINQSFGTQSGLPDFMINIHRIDDAGGARDYVTRLGKMGMALDQLLASVRYREAQGVVPPRFVIQRVLEEMRGFIASPPQENPLYQRFLRDLGKLGEIDDAEGQRLREAAQAAIQESVYPAYQRLIAYHAEVEKRASTDDGVWKLPDGERYYAQCLRFHTTTTLSAEEIHQMGLDEVTRLKKEMLEILHGQGYEGESIGAIARELATQERFFYPDTDAGRQEILAAYQTIIEEVDAGVGRLFSRRPRSGVEVERMPQFKEKTAPGAYYQPAPLDGARPGRFYVNLRDVREVPKYTMRTLAYHEAIPGHHFQISLARELENVPIFRRVVPFTAYSEGWALYAERLAAEHGFQEEPLDRFGYLTAQMFRAVRLVVDTGIHQKRWTRQRAIDYMVEYTGMPEGEVTSEVERYIVTPGQACAYKIGQLKILELRDRAKRSLGESFELVAFHDVLLSHGAVPLAVLELLVQRWVEGQATAGS